MTWTPIAVTELFDHILMALFGMFIFLCILKAMFGGPD